MYVYILRCTDSSLYTGITTDIKKRIRQHMGEIKGGARYTRSHSVEKVEVLFETDSDTGARKLECALKKLSRGSKEKLIREPETLTSVLAGNLNEYTYILSDCALANEIVRKIRMKCNDG